MSEKLLADFADHHVHRALVDLDFRAVDEHGVEDFRGQILADSALHPIILGRHRPRHLADILRAAPTRGRSRPDGWCG